MFGNRIEKAVDFDGDGPNAAVVTRYVLDGWNNQQARCRLATSTVRHPRRIGRRESTDRPLSCTATSSTRRSRGWICGAANASERVQWYLTDHLNSVRLVLDESGAILDQIAYDAFGNIVAQLNPLLGEPDPVHLA
jgi:hypothetical protein